MESIDVDLGTTYTDSITGFSGTATAKIEYLRGSKQALLETAIDGKPQSLWVDYERLQRLDA